MAVEQMRTLVQSCTRELRYFVGPSETVFVLVGSYQQYTVWVMERPGLKTRYVNDINRLRGLQFPLVVRAGSWEDRPDIREVESRLFEMGASEGEFPPGQYLPYPEWVERQPMASRSTRRRR